MAASARRGRSPERLGAEFEAVWQSQAMALTAILEFHFKPGVLEQARELAHRVLEETRAFDGNLGVDVLIDTEDEYHWLALERWESLEHDLAYREFRSGPGFHRELATLVESRKLVKYTLDPGI